MKINIKTTFWDNHSTKSTQRISWWYGILFIGLILISTNILQGIVAGIGLLSSIVLNMSHTKWERQKSKELYQQKEKPKNTSEN